MTLDEVPHVVLEEADRVRVGLADLARVEARVEVRRISRAIITRKQLEGVRAETVEGVEVCA